MMDGLVGVVDLIAGGLRADDGTTGLTADGREIRDVVFSSRSFENVDFRAVSIVVVEFNSCTFVDCRFDGVSIDMSDFKNCAFTRTVFDGIRVYGLGFQGCRLSHCSMRDARCRGLYFTKCWLLSDDVSDSSDDSDVPSWQDREPDVMSPRGRTGGLDLARSRIDYGSISDSVAMLAILDDAVLRGVDMGGTTLMGSSFRNATLVDCGFSGAELVCKDVFSKWFWYQNPHLHGPGEWVEVLGWDDLRGEAPDDFGTCHVDFAGIRHNSDEMGEDFGGTTWPRGFLAGPGSMSRDELPDGDDPYWR